MALLTQKSVLLAKIESTYGTDPTPTTSADAISVYNVEVEVTREPQERRPIDVTLSPLQPIMGLGEAKISFEVDLKGSGTAGTAPDWLVLAKSCGYVNTNVPSTSDTLAADNTPTDSCTIYAYKDGLLYELNGCRGEMKLVMEAGKIPKLKFEMQGIYVLPVDATLPSAITVDTTKPVTLVATTFTFGSYAAITEKLELGLGNEIVRNDDLNATFGVQSFEIVGRKPTGKMTVNAVLRATSNADFWSYMSGGTTKALSIAFGSGAGQVVTITAPVCTVTQVKPSSKNGIDTFEIEFELDRSAAGGGDEISIALT